MLAKLGLIVFVLSTIILIVCAIILPIYRKKCNIYERYIQSFCLENHADSKCECTSITDYGTNANCQAVNGGSQCFGSQYVDTFYCDFWEDTSHKIFWSFVGTMVAVGTIWVSCIVGYAYYSCLDGCSTFKRGKINPI